MSTIPNEYIVIAPSAGKEANRWPAERFGELAAKLGGKGYARAVGRACNTNPLAIIIPCHRVVGANGHLYGFGGGGIGVKKQLLGLEQAQLNLL